MSIPRTELTRRWATLQYAQYNAQLQKQREFRAAFRRHYREKKAVIEHLRSRLQQCESENEQLRCEACDLRRTAEQLRRSAEASTRLAEQDALGPAEQHGAIQPVHQEELPLPQQHGSIQPVHREELPLPLHQSPPSVPSLSGDTLVSDGSPQAPEAVDAGDAVLRSSLEAVLRAGEAPLQTAARTGPAADGEDRLTADGRHRCALPAVADENIGQATERASAGGPDGAGSVEQIAGGSVAVIGAVGPSDGRHAARLSAEVRGSAAGGPGIERAAGYVSDSASGARHAAASRSQSAQPLDSLRREAGPAQPARSAPPATHPVGTCLQELACSPAKCEGKSSTALQRDCPEAHVGAAAHTVAQRGSLVSVSNCRGEMMALESRRLTADPRRHPEQPGVAEAQASRGWKRKRGRDDNFMPDVLPAALRTAPGASRTTRADDPANGQGGPSQPHAPGRIEDSAAVALGLGGGDESDGALPGACVLLLEPGQHVRSVGRRL